MRALILCNEAFANFIATGAFHTVAGRDCSGSENRIFSQANRATQCYNSPKIEEGCRNVGGAVLDRFTRPTSTPSHSHLRPFDQLRVPTKRDSSGEGVALAEQQCGEEGLGVAVDDRARLRAVRRNPTSVHGACQ